MENNNKGIYIGSLPTKEEMVSLAKDFGFKIKIVGGEFFDAQGALADNLLIKQLIQSVRDEKQSISRENIAIAKSIMEYAAASEYVNEARTMNKEFDNKKRLEELESVQPIDPSIFYQPKPEEEMGK